MRTGTGISEVVQRIREYNSFFLVSHVDPDGDAMGSLLGLSLGLLSLGKEVWSYCHRPPRPPLSRLLGVELLKTQLPEDLRRYACVVLDCASKERLGLVRNRMGEFLFLINIDHHITNQGFGDLNWIEPTASSVGEMLVGLLRELGVEFHEGISENLYYAIQTDTGGFRFDNTTPKAMAEAFYLMEKGMRPWNLYRRTSKALRLGKLRLLCHGLDTLQYLDGGDVLFVALTKEIFQRIGVDPEEAEDLSDIYRSLEGVEVVVVAREVESGHFKFSMRSNGGVDLSKVAVAFGGGGHRSAAGFEYLGGYQDVLHRLSSLIREAKISFG